MAFKMNNGGKAVGKPGANQSFFPFRCSTPGPITDGNSDENLLSSLSPVELIENHQLSDQAVAITTYPIKLNCWIYTSKV
jgi:hypothetical protein